MSRRALGWCVVAVLSLSAMGCGSSDEGDGGSAGDTAGGAAATSGGGGESGNGSAASGGSSGAAGQAACDPITLDYASYAMPLFNQRCLFCHSANLSGTARNGAPEGVNFDTEDDITQHASLIWARVIEMRNMPPGAPFDDCEAQHLADYLSSLGGTPCEPDCTGRQCGSDGCSGSCGGCDAAMQCDDASGQCVAAACTPNCQGVACGDDGCGGSCGTCGAGLSCNAAGACECTPQCSGKTCGDDGCGGTCGSCAGNEVCGLGGNCLCLPDCSGKLCGDDGCGGTCGTCRTGDTCDATGTACSCVPNCAGRMCGPDGCGGTCGLGCMGVLVCNTRSGRCSANCTADCSGRDCGDDGCGGTCGAGCGTGETCTAAGQCICEPDCLGKACGDDGCGGTCGSCPSGTQCNAGQCGCNVDCTGRECGDDGCGGTCGPGCGAGEVCQNGMCGTQCVPDCSGKSCGDDGCGGSCGGCPSGQSCFNGGCIFPAVGFSGVYPILEIAGCGSGACHGGVRPAEGLNLSSESTAYANLVNVNASQCSNKKRVAPGDPDNSYLINKVTGVGMCFGSKMPKTGAGLTANQIDQLRSWIGSGADP